MTNNYNQDQDNQNNQNQGKFIVFEGIDGSGSSTQAQLLYDYCIANNRSAVLSPEPTSGKIGKLLREFLVGNDYFRDRDLYDQQMAYLFTADRHYHLYNKIDGVKTLTQKNNHVITTRYYFSSLAYNAKNEQEYQFVSLLNQQFPPPDFLIYCDIPVDVALERIERRSTKEIYETKDKLIQVSNNFNRILENYSHSYLKVDATLSPEEIHQQILEYIGVV